ncbi:response regulator [Puteibacter caeruleilacunae]|nr:response regulator [Puteibacter caeruleilacunae]
MSNTEVYNWSDKVILVVEDEEVNTYFFQAALRKTEAKLLFASSGREAIDLATSDTHIDLILMDIRLPELDGYEATRQIKEKRPEIPIVAQTAYAMANERENILKAGCNDYISKPIRFKVLMDTIAKYLD